MNYGIKSFTFLLINPKSLSPTEKKIHFQFLVGASKGFKIDKISYIGDSQKASFPVRKCFHQQLYLGPKITCYIKDN